jgi:SAM-dependent methyltransferase
MTDTHYTLDNAWNEARQRLRLLEEVADPISIPHLKRLGVSTGWHCLDIGAGGGSLAAWLCERVGPTGRVVATDLDIRFLEAIASPQLDVRRHNILTDALEEGAFDLVHTRSVLMHFGAGAAVRDIIAKLVRALKPGGWFLFEEPSGPYLPAPTASARFRDLFERQFAATRQVLTAAGGDNFYGYRLYGDVLELGNRDAQAEGHIAVGRGGSPWARYFQVTFDQYCPALVATGQVTDAEVAELRGLFDDPATYWFGPGVVVVWGQRP